MKKVFNLISASLILVFALLLSGCSCSSPMSIKYYVATDSSADFRVDATVIKKFREPSSTPCYKKVKKGYTKLESSAEIEECLLGNIECFRKVGRKEYEEVSTPLDVVKCQEDKNCYQKSGVTYYKLLTDPEGVSACYDADGNAFERATYNKEEKIELESKVAIDKSRNWLSFESSTQKMPSNSKHSLIYEFVIKNNQNTTLYVEALEFNTITGGTIKESSASKIKLTMPENRLFKNNKYYYSIGANQSETIKIEIKNLKTSDAKGKSAKEFKLNISLSTL